MTQRLRLSSTSRKAGVGALLLGALFGLATGCARRAEPASIRAEDEVKATPPAANTTGVLPGVASPPPSPAVVGERDGRLQPEAPRAAQPVPPADKGRASAPASKAAAPAGPRGASESQGQLPDFDAKPKKEDSSLLSPEPAKDRARAGELDALRAELQATYASLGHALELAQPDCESAGQFRDRVCALSEQICRLAEQQPTPSANATCTDGRERCRESHKRFDESCGSP